MKTRLLPFLHAWVAMACISIPLLRGAAVQARPANDDFADRIPLTGSTAEFPAGIEGSSYEPGEPQLPWSRGSAWWSWIAPEDGVLVVWVPAALESQLAIFIGTGIADLRSPVAVQNAPWPGVTAVAVNGGDPVAIQLGESLLDASPPGNAELRFLPRPANDTFATRTPLVGLPARTSAPLTGAAWRDLSHGSLPVAGEIWWSWVAPESGPVTFQLEVPPPGEFERGVADLAYQTPLTLDLYTPPPEGTTPNSPLHTRVLSAPSLPPSLFADLTFPVIAGHEYALRLRGWLSPSVTPSLQIVGGVLPELLLVAPTNHALFAAGEPVTIGALATKAPPGLLPREIEFDLVDLSRGGTLRTERILTPPHRQILTDLAPGAYRLTARARDAHGTVTESSPVDFAVIQRNQSPETAEVLAGASAQVRGQVGSQAFCGAATGVPQAGCDSWWSWRAPADGRYTVAVTPGGSAPVGYALFLQQGLAPLNLVPMGTPVQEWTGLPSPTASISFTATAGQTFLIMIQGFNGQAADFDLRVLNSGGPEVGILSPHSPADLAVGHPLTLEAEATKPGVHIEQVSYWALKEGQQTFLGTERIPPYRIQVDTPIGFLLPGDYQLVARALAADGSSALSPPVPLHVLDAAPGNDALADRIPLQAEGPWVEGTSFGATLEPGEPQPPGEGTAWWGFTPAASGRFTLVVRGSGWVTLFGGGPAPEALIQEHSLAVDTLTPERSLTFDAAAGVERFISLSGDPFPVASNHISLRIVTGSPPSVELKGTLPQYARVGDLITLEAVATDAEGPVSRVDFILDGKVLSRLTSPPFTLTFPVPGPPGLVPWRFGAIAYDASGLHSDTSASLNLAHLAPLPPNDSFAQRTPIAGLPAVAQGTGDGATFEPGTVDDPTFALVSGDVWYSWRSPRSGTVAISLVPVDPAGLSQTLRVWQGTGLNNLRLVGEASDYWSGQGVALGGTGSSVIFPAVAGEEYVVQVLEAERFVLRIRERSSWGIQLLVGAPTPAPEGGVQVTLEARIDADQADIESVTFLGDRTPTVLTAPPYRTTVLLTTDLVNQFQPSRISFSARFTDTDGGIWVATPVDLSPNHDIPPADNDDFEHRAPLGGYVARILWPPLTRVTLEPVESKSFGETGSAWWTWVAPESGQATLSYNTALAPQIYTGETLSTLNRVPVMPGAGLPSHDVHGSVLSFQATAGVAYAIRFGSQLPWLSGLEWGLYLQPDRVIWPVYQPGGGFEFSMASPRAGRWQVEVSSDLREWVPLGGPQESPGLIDLFDPAAAGEPHRYYRAVPIP